MWVGVRIVNSRRMGEVIACDYSTWVRMGLNGLDVWPGASWIMIKWVDDKG